MSFRIGNNHYKWRKGRLVRINDSGEEVESTHKRNVPEYHPAWDKRKPGDKSGMWENDLTSGEAGRRAGEFYDNKVSGGYRKMQNGGPLDPPVAQPSSTATRGPRELARENASESNIGDSLEFLDNEVNLLTSLNENFGYRPEDLQVMHPSEEGLGSNTMGRIRISDSDFAREMRGGQSGDYKRSGLVLAEEIAHDVHNRALDQLGPDSLKSIGREIANERDIDNADKFISELIPNNAENYISRNKEKVAKFMQNPLQRIAANQSIEDNPTRDVSRERDSFYQGLAERLLDETDFSDRGGQEGINIEGLGEGQPLGSYIYNQDIMNNAYGGYTDRELGIGGWLKDNAGNVGTVVGGAAGLAIGNPMLGATLGRSAGTAVGSAFDDEEEQRQAQAMNRRIRMESAPATSGSYGFKFGGLLDKTNEVMARGGKLKNMKGNRAEKVMGPRHEQGGVKLDQNTEVEGGETLDNVDTGKASGEYVFSDRLTIPGKDITFAEMHEQLINNNASQEQIDKLAQMQEKVRSQSEMAYGGKTKEYKGGGYKEMQNGGFEDPLPDYIPGGDLPSEPDYSSLDFGLNMTQDVMDSMRGPQSPQGEQSFLGQAGNVAQEIAPYVPAIVNTGRALFEGEQDTDVPHTPTPSTGEQTIREMETDVNVEPQIAAVNRSLRSVTSDPRASMNEKIAASSKAQQQASRIRAQAENRETQRENQQLSTLAQMQRQRAQTNAQRSTQAAQREQELELRSEAARDQMLTTGLQQGVRTYLQQKAQETKSDVQKMALRAALSGNIDAVNRRALIRLRNSTDDEQLRESLDQILQPEE